MRIIKLEAWLGDSFNANHREVLGSIRPGSLGLILIEIRLGYLRLRVDHFLSEFGSLSDFFDENITHKICKTIPPICHPQYEYNI